MSAPLDRTRRRWFAPEVVQSSAMDCGPAALKCLLEGFGIPVSYGRLREACQTDVDGTSIDTIETVANALGVVADQILIPIEHVLIDPSALPALVVVRHADEPNHFVVAWRRAGNRVQMMDPAVGRRWQHRVDVARDLLRHETSVPAAAWRAWAGTDAFLTPFGARLRAIGVTGDSARSLITRGCDDAGWFTLGTLDAATRLVASLVDASALRPGAETRRLLTALVDDTSTATDDIFRHIPRSHWSVQPDGEATDVTEQHLRLRGAVLLRVRGRRAERPTAASVTATTGARTDAPALSPELAAALSTPREHPLRALWTLLRADGLLGPAALAGAVVLASIATLVEALLMRGMFTIGDRLPLGSQRALAVGGLLGFVAIGLAVRLPIAVETLRTGRRLDARLRMALLAKLPRLTDRYFHSRPLSDLAERSHNIQQLRQLPGIALHGLQVLCELVLTLVGIALIAPASLPLALVIASGAILVPAFTQPLINERDLRTRQHAGALGRFYLDALLGLVPIRAHRAETAVRIQHQSLLVEWARSTRRVIQTALAASTGQALVGTALGALLVVQHFSRTQQVTGADLLLVYWALKVPSLGTGLTALAQQYPMQRSILLRLLEPLSAPEPASVGTPVSVPVTSAAPAHVAHIAPAGVAISLTNGTVVAAGHRILRQVTLRVAAGEHIGIVGVSGAGKSTLIGLLLGWHRLSEGHLCLDDAEADTAAIEALRTQTAWVDPAVQLWNRPLLDNVTYASRTSDTVRAAEAIEAASLNGVVGALPLGLQTPLGEGGALLSGGEGQRVRLARALAQPDVRLALLDEPFRGMDRDQRTALLAEARARWCDATLLCVTHDVTDTLTFDRVLVVERGTIVEDGSPAHLMATASRYRDLLHAEQRVRERLWQGPHWRRIRVAGGQVEQVEQVEHLEQVDAPVVTPVAAAVVA